MTYKMAFLEYRTQEEVALLIEASRCWGPTGTRLGMATQRCPVPEGEGSSPDTERHGCI